MKAVLAQGRAINKKSSVAGGPVILLGILVAEKEERDSFAFIILNPRLLVKDQTKI
jgi:hypothetical protein